MNFGQWYLRRGRINRHTYWLHYFLPLFLLGVIVEAIVFAVSWSSLQAASQSSGTASVPAALFWLPAVLFLVTIVPGISAQVTRLHDRGHSAWWLLFDLLPFAGPIVLLVQMCLPGDSGSNRYGPPPKSGRPTPDAPRPAAQN